MRLIYTFLFFILLDISLTAQIVVQEVKDSFSLSSKARDNILAGDYGKAIENLNEALVLDSNEREAYIVFYQLYYQLDQLDQQKKYLQVANRRFANDSQFAYYLGKAYASENNLDSAIYFYSKAIEYNEADYQELILVPDYYASRGVCYLKRQQYENAIKDFTKAINLDEYKSSAFANRGVAYYKIGEKQKACRSWEKASELGESSVDVYIRKFCEDFK